MTIRRHTWLVISAIAVAPGCGVLINAVPAIPGSGVSKEESRPVEAFHGLEAGSTLQVTVAVTPGAKPSLKISGDENLVPLIESVVRDGTLILRVKENANLRPNLPPSD